MRVSRLVDDGGEAGRVAQEVLVQALLLLHCEGLCLARSLQPHSASSVAPDPGGGAACDEEEEEQNDSPGSLARLQSYQIVHLVP